MDSQIPLFQDRSLSREILDQIPLIVIVADRTGAIVYVNPAVETILGYKPADALGDGWWNLTRSETRDPEKEKQQIERWILDERQHGAPYERSVPDSQGRQHMIVWRDFPGPNQTLIGYGQDITEQRQIEERLRAARQAAELASRAKTEFLANMSHELRTPLNGILGTLEVVMQDKLDDELRENLHMAQNSSEHLLVLLNDLLDTAKLEAGEIELESNPTSIKEVVQTVCNTFMHAAVQKGIELQASIDTQAPDYVLTDPTRLKQILMNLVGNAIKFTSAGGVEVKVITAEVEDGLQRLQFAVADSGVGIAADAVDTIFERFKQADGSTTRNFGGTGLGLALCKDLTELMGGSIHVTSELGQGSVFTVDIPFQVTTGQPSDVSAQTAQSQLGLSQARILVAEDNQTNQIVVKKLLQKLGFEYIDIVADGQAALDRWLAQGYDIILMDCQMPGMDGLEATTRIREEERSRKASPVPIIAVTANASMLEQQECLDAGMSDHLSKPLRLRSLADMMLQYLQADESPAERAS